jgi:hypothetical protein
MTASTSGWAPGDRLRHDATNEDIERCLMWYATPGVYDGQIREIRKFAAACLAARASEPPVAYEFVLDGERHIKFDEDCQREERKNGIPLYRSPPASPSPVARSVDGEQNDL